MRRDLPGVQDLLGAVAALALIGGCSAGDVSEAPAPIGGAPPLQGPPPPPPPQAATATTITSPEMASRFLAAASFGGTPREIDDMVGTDAAEWLEDQFDARPTLFLPSLRGLSDEDARGGDRRRFSDDHWEAMILADDQLRMRMVFALSQILVVSLETTNDARVIAYYADVLSEGAFGNYRDLLEEVTYSPIMADFLTYLRNRKGDPERGRMPDENYARELLQLFTLGVVELNPDGTARAGNPEVFDNEDIVGLARVFTGLSLVGREFFDEDDDSRYQRLIAFPEEHSDLEKSFLGETIPAGTGPEASISQALDIIFEHPNVGPFLARQLIQRFTASSPSPDYVERVAAAFDAGRFTAPAGQTFGTGQRGDLEATLAAILLDPSWFDMEATTVPTSGKIREPILRFIHWARAFELAAVNAANENELRDTRDPADSLAHQPFRSASVFNFYRPGFVAPGTETGAAGLTAPEFQLVNESTAIGFVNFITDYAFDRSNTLTDVPSFIPNYAPQLALSEDPEALVDQLDTLLTAGMLSEASRAAIIETVTAIPIRENAVEADRARRVEVAVLMVITSPAFAVQR